jgi:hypothetical protein
MFQPGKYAVRCILAEFLESPKHGMLLHLVFGKGSQKIDCFLSMEDDREDNQWEFVRVFQRVFGFDDDDLTTIPAWIEVNKPKCFIEVVEYAKTPS